MKAMILSAGLGMRLRPLTEKRPKALMPIANKPIIDRTIAYLKRCGVSQVIVNAHHHHRQIIDHLAGGRPFRIPIEVRVEPEILGTGGGIRNMADFPGVEPFIVINGDILTDIDLKAALKVHSEGESLATLVVHDLEKFSKIRLNDRMNITEISREVRPGGLAFTGIHILSPAFVGLFNRTGPFDIIDCYREWIGAGKALGAYVSRGHYWRDIGSVPDYIRANREALGPSRYAISGGCSVHDSARLTDWAVIGEGVVVQAGAVVARSVIWEGATIRRGIRVADSVVTAGREVSSHLSGGVL